MPALYLPTPRVALGVALRGVATSAIDISDGLLGDLGHILRALGRRRRPSRSRLEFAALPTLPVAQAYLHEQVARDCVLAGGDDYELLLHRARRRGATRSPPPRNRPAWR